MVSDRVSQHRRPPRRHYQFLNVQKMPTASQRYIGSHRNNSKPGVTSLTGAAPTVRPEVIAGNTQFWKPVDQWRRVSCSGSQKLQLSKIRDTVLIKWRRYEASCATFEESYRSHQVVQATQRGAHTSLESGRLDRKISSEKLENEWNGLGIVL